MRIDTMTSLIGQAAFTEVYTEELPLPTIAAPTLPFSTDPSAADFFSDDAAATADRARYAKSISQQRRNVVQDWRARRVLSNEYVVRENLRNTLHNAPLPVYIEQQINATMPLANMATAAAPWVPAVAGAVAAASASDMLVKQGWNTVAEFFNADDRRNRRYSLQLYRAEALSRAAEKFPSDPTAQYNFLQDQWRADQAALGLEGVLLEEEAAILTAPVTSATPNLEEQLGALVLAPAALAAATLRPGVRKQDTRTPTPPQQADAPQAPAPEKELSTGELIGTTAAWLAAHEADAANLATSIGILLPRYAHKANKALEIYRHVSTASSALNAIVNGVASGGGNPYLTLATVGLQLFSMFKSKDTGPTADQMILEALSGLQQQLTALEGKIDAYHQEEMTYLRNIYDTLQRFSHETGEQLDRIEQTLDIEMARLAERVNEVERKLNDVGALHIYHRLDNFLANGHADDARVLLGHGTTTTSSGCIGGSALQATVCDSTLLPQTQALQNYATERALERTSRNIAEAHRARSATSGAPIDWPAPSIVTEVLKKCQEYPTLYTEVFTPDVTQSLRTRLGHLDDTRNDIRTNTAYFTARLTERTAAVRVVQEHLATRTNAYLQAWKIRGHLSLGWGFLRNRYESQEKPGIAVRRDWVRQRCTTVPDAPEICAPYGSYFSSDAQRTEYFENLPRALAGDAATNATPYSQLPQQLAEFFSYRWQAVGVAVPEELRNVGISVYTNAIQSSVLWNSACYRNGADPIPSCNSYRAVEARPTGAATLDPEAYSPTGGSPLTAIPPYFAALYTAGIVDQPTLTTIITTDNRVQEESTRIALNLRAEFTWRAYNNAHTGRLSLGVHVTDLPHTKWGDYVRNLHLTEFTESGDQQFYTLNVRFDTMAWPTRPLKATSQTPPAPQTWWNGLRHNRALASSSLRTSDLDQLSDTSLKLIDDAFAERQQQMTRLAQLLAIRDLLPPAIVQEGVARDNTKIAPQLNLNVLETPLRDALQTIRQIDAELATELAFAYYHAVPKAPSSPLPHQLPLMTTMQVMTALQQIARGGIPPGLAHRLNQQLRPNFSMGPTEANQLTKQGTAAAQVINEWLNQGEALRASVKAWAKQPVIYEDTDTIYQKLPPRNN